MYNLLEKLDNNLLGGSKKMNTIEKLLDEINDYSKTDDNSMYKMTQEFLDKLNSAKYAEYIDNIEEYYKSNAKDLGKVHFYKNLEGNLVKANVKKQKVNIFTRTSIEEEYQIKTPEYQRVNILIKYLNDNIFDLENEVSSLRDIINSDSSKEVKDMFDEMKNKYNKYIEKRNILNEYIIIANKNIDNKMSELSVEKSNVREKLRLLHKEIVALSQKIPIDTELYEEKIKEYLTLNKINSIDRSIKELNNEDRVDYYIRTLPSKIIKKVVEEPKKKIVKKRKTKTQKGGKDINIDELVEKINKYKGIEEDDEDNIDNENSVNEYDEDTTLDFKEYDRLDLEEDIKGGSASENSDNEEEDDEYLEENEDYTNEVISQEEELEEELEPNNNNKIGGGDNMLDDLDDNLDELKEFDFSIVDETNNTNNNVCDNLTQKMTNDSEIKKIKISNENTNFIENLPELSDNLEELSRNDDEESNYDYNDDLENYSFENTYSQNNDDSVDLKIPLELESNDLNINEPVKVIKLN